MLAQSAVAFSVVKYAGAVYLIYLGVRTCVDREGFAAPSGVALVSPKSVFFVQGVASNVANPKVALFFWHVCGSSRSRPALATLLCNC